MKKKAKRQSNIKFTILEDFRTFKKGETFEIEVNPIGITYVVGKNGSGKSTILQILRGLKDSLYKVNKERANGMTLESIETIKRNVLPKVKVDGFDYDEVYCLDSVVDDPSSLINSCTATSFILGGGMMLQKASKGEKSIYLINRFRKDIEKSIGGIEYIDVENTKRLFIIDEIDEGLDLKLQLLYNRILEVNFNLKYFGDVLVVSHNILCTLSDCSLKPKIFNLDTRQMTTAEEYIKEKTDGKYTIKIEEVNQKEHNGSEQDN
jgi:predicted ATPase